MKFKFLMFFVAFLTFSFLSKAQDEPTEESVKTELENGVVNFVNTVKNVLPSSEYSSYDEFRLKLIGGSNVSSVTAEGNALLEVAYELINTNASEDAIKETGRLPFARATKVVLDFENENGFSGPKLTAGSIALWGGHEEGLLSAEAVTDNPCGDYKECKWYQVGCHVHNVGVWICRNEKEIGVVIKTLEVAIKVWDFIF